ncbi:MAG: glycosyltransferase [Candidatus Hodarchaeota archaeon]
MRIAIFSDSWVPNLNGVVISIINEIQSLRDKHEFIIFVPKLKQSKRFRIEGVPIYELRSIPFPAYPGYNIALPSLSFTKAIKEEQIDLIHCHSPFSLGYGAIFIARVLQDLPMLNTYHTDLVKYSGHLIGGFQANRFTPWFERFAWIYIRWFYKFSDVVITPSKTLQQTLKSHGVKPPVYSLPNMISSVFFDSRDKSESIRFQDQIRVKYGISSDQRIILYCGRISYEKKLEVMLKAFKQIEKKYPDIFLLVVGDGPHLKMYKKQALQLKLENYAFTGFLSHTKLPYVYQMGEFMVTPSDTETQGLTVIEAMSQKLPVIGVAEGGVLDYIQDGKNGFLVPPGDPEAFAQAMVQFLENPEYIPEYGSNAYKIAQKYSKSGFISLLDKVFKITLEVHNSGGKK